MSDNTLPKSINPLKYADQQKVVEGQLSISLLPRLTEMLVDPSGVVEVKLTFGRDEQNLRVLHGELRTTLKLMCERCLSPVEKPIASRFTLGIVLTDEQAQNLPRDYEPLLVERDKLERDKIELDRIDQDKPVLLDLAELVEEELILSLPMFVYHDNCVLEYNAQTDDAPVKANDEVNSFSVLSELKLKK